MSSSSPIVVLGARGQLGSDLVRAAVARGLDVVPLGHEEVDVTRAEDVLRALDQVRPSVVINSAAFHQLDRCEEDPHQAYEVNAVGALAVARATRSVGARYLYISTDYVFPGDKPACQDGNLTPETAYTEGDAVRPLNVYGAS